MEIMPKIALTILIVVGLFFLVMSILEGIKPIDNGITIIRDTTDNRGLTSVIYIQRGDTFALDYLTKGELDSLKNIK